MAVSRKSETGLRFMKPFVLCLTEAAAGKKCHHFRTVKNGLVEVKIYFTSEKIILAHFNNREFIDFKTRQRSSRESLLGFEVRVSEAIRNTTSNAQILHLCH